MGGWMDGRIDGRTDGWMGCSFRRKDSYKLLCLLAIDTD